MQHELPRLICCIAFLCFALFSAILAFSMPRFTDLWALASFCGAMFFIIWVETPFYWEAYTWDGAVSQPFFLARTLARWALAVTAVALTLSFFRVRGAYLWLIFGLTVASATFVVLHRWPYPSELPPYRQHALVDTEMTSLLVISQLITFAFGVSSLRTQMRTFKRAGLEALVPPMRRRLGEAGVFTLAMAVMLGAYVVGMPLQSVTSGPDLFLLFALAPATVIFIQFYWMMGASTRFREKLLPQLDYVDYLVMELKDKALSQSYDGVLAAFDLKGFKRLTALKRRSPVHRQAIDRLLQQIQSDISRLISHQRTVFRYKSNGDEWLFALYARDAAAAQAILVAIATAWRQQADGLMQRWRTAIAGDLRLGLGADLGEEDAATLAELDLHVMMCVLKDLRVNVEDGRSRPDFVSDSFTLLTPAYKEADGRAIAMYADEAAQVLATWSPTDATGYFVPLTREAAHPAGLLRWSAGAQTAATAWDRSA